MAAAAMMEWYRGEFAAANAIIDELCRHLVEMSGNYEYDMVMEAIQMRRAHWFPVLHLQNFCSITQVASELRRVAHSKINPPMKCTTTNTDRLQQQQEEYSDEKIKGNDVVADDATALSSHGHPQEESSEPEDTVILPAQDDSTINTTKKQEQTKKYRRFVAKEHVNGHMVNVVKGLKVYEDIFTESQLCTLATFINELRAAGRRGDLSGESSTCSNKQSQPNNTKIIQLGVPVFPPTTGENTNNIEPIPSVLQDVVNHMVQWRLIPESKRPNSCLINFIDENEHSQSYLKPPQLENPISKLLLHETTMAFGRALASDKQGDFKGSLRLPLKKGSVLVMRGHSASMARHAVCPSPNARVSITFAKVVSLTSKESYESQPEAMQVPPNFPHQFTPPPRHVQPVLLRSMQGGTGVFLPWTVGPNKYVKQLPPRIQKRMLPALPPELAMQVRMASQIPCLLAG